MRLSFILSSLWLSGGVMLVVEYANQLAARNHTVHLIIPGTTVDPAIGATLDSRVVLLETREPLPPRPTLFNLIKLSLSLAWAIPPSDVLVATHTPTVVPTLLAGVLRNRGHCTWLYMDYDEMFKERPIERFLLHNAPRWFECIMTISGPTQQCLAQQIKAPVVMTGSGLRRPDLFFNQTCPPLLESGRQVLYVGDDRPRKGLREFIAAAELVSDHISDLTFVIVSKRPCSIDTHIPYKFHLRPSDAQLANLYRSSHLFVSASWGEGLGYPPLEAMACGTPVILTNSGGVLDYAQDGENCLMVPPQDSHTLAEAMKSLLSDDDLALRLSQNGQLTAQRYTWAAAIDRFEAALADFVNPKK